jgi:thiamine-monophosphate kinase
MNEFELLARLIPRLPTSPTVIAGAGDDCAVLDLNIPGKFLLFKTDAVVQGVHFELDTPPEKVGRKALARCLSDIAAMAGTPTHALVTIGLPADFPPSQVEEIYRGLNSLARRCQIAIAGGETTLNPERVFISIALLGMAPREKCILRSGAKPGDALFVTGQLGGSILGKHLEFEPRLEEGRWLAEHFPINAMIDLSDGLAGDLRHLTTASGVGAELLGSAIPISREAHLRARQERMEAVPEDPGKAAPPSHPMPPALKAALTDGEDFELLFSLPSIHAVRLLDAWKKKFPTLPLSCIGKITVEPGLFLKDKHGKHPLDLHGYIHFA